MEPTKDSNYIQQHLANERTYLAWIRTALAIIGTVHYERKRTQINEQTFKPAVHLVWLISGLMVVMVILFFLYFYLY
ncbi:DUF202 domain-containing protein [Alkalibacillus silvisoli]|uniref:YidH family protein n=1 Tax=Alkalibacillus silvisoli TaxID=392823 RepID=UPI0031CF3CC9